MSSDYKIPSRVSQTALKTYNLSQAYEKFPPPKEDSATLESIIGIDQRKKVENVQDFPWRAIGCVSSKGGGAGSGVLIASNVVLTCAHNVYSISERRRSNNLIFTPAQEGIQGKVFKVTSTMYDPAYETAYNSSDYDMAILILEQSAHEYGRFGIHSIGQHDELWKNLEVTVSGYPGDKFVDWIYRYQYYQKGKVDHAQKNLIQYQIDTYPGQSGAPVYYKGNDGHYYVVGVHILGTGPYGNFNSASRITKKRFEWIQSFLENRIKNQRTFSGSLPLKSDKNRFSQNVEIKSNPIKENLSDTKKENCRRVKANTSNYPYSAIGVVVAEGVGYSTGFIVGHNSILTVAADQDFGLTKFSFYPGLSENKSKKYEIIDYEVIKSTTNNQQNKVVILRTKENLQKIYGSIGVQVLSQNQAIKKKNFQISGYPADLSYQSKNQYKESGAINHFKNGKWIYDITTSGGNAGSPIFSSQDKMYFAAGVHEGRSFNGQRFGSAFTNDLYFKIKKRVAKNYQITFNKPKKEIKNVSEEKVIGYRDTRLMVKDTKISPFRSIGWLSLSTNKGKYMGTGTIIEKNIVLTCGHNLIGDGSKTENVQFFPGLNQRRYNEKDHSKSFTSKRFVIHPKYTKENRFPSEYDFALIIFDEDLSSQFGQVDYETISPLDEKFDKQLYVCGYPSDLIEKRGWVYNQYQDRSKITNLTEYFIEHEIDTYGGNSGSSMYYINPKTNQATIVGVHTSALNYYDLNRGIRLNQEHIALINNTLRFYGMDQDVKQLVIDNGQFDAWRGIDGDYKKKVLQVLKVVQSIANPKRKTLRGYVESIKNYYNSIGIVEISQKEPVEVNVIVVEQNPFGGQDSNKYENKTENFKQWQNMIPTALKRLNQAVPGLKLVQYNYSSNMARLRGQYNIWIGPGNSGAYAIGNLFNNEYFQHIGLFNYPRIFLGDPRSFGGNEGNIATVIHEIIHALGFAHDQKGKNNKQFMHAPYSMLQFYKMTKNRYDYLTQNLVRKAQLQQLPANPYVEQQIDELKSLWYQYSTEDKYGHATSFDPYAIMLYPEDMVMHRDQKSVLGAMLWKDKPDNFRVSHMSQLDKLGLNMIYPPVKTSHYNPVKSKKNHLYYCGRKLQDSSDPSIIQDFNGKDYTDHEINYVCQEKSGRNCPSCRVLENYDSELLLTAGKDNIYRWQGWSGRLYCHQPRKGQKGEELMCGPNCGPSCDVCDEIYKSFKGSY